MPKHNKQHLPHAASLRRIAKELRVQAKLSKENVEAPLIATLLRRIATAHETEARTLGTLR